jgi:hypothetical protein
LTLACGCMKTNVLPYEGMENMVQEASGNMVQEASGNMVQEASGNMVQEASGNMVQEASGNMVQEESGNMVEEASGNMVQEEGFTTLSYVNIDNTSQIESISTVKGSMSCLSQSFNLTNSMGPLCLTQEQQIALQTRGGNASPPHI